MERYTLSELYSRNEFLTTLHNYFDDGGIYSDGTMIMGLNLTAIEPVLSFLSNAIYGYFYDDLVAYAGDTEDDARNTFEDRLVYDIAVKMPYWYRKYNQIKKLLTTEDLSLLQTSKVVSSSNDKTNTASGTLQKTATTPTGVSTGTAEDSIDIEISESGDNDTTANVITTGFADKYTNAQQKFANAGRVEGERSGTITREGSIDELLKVLEKLPSSFADEINKSVQKHFIFDYEGEERGIYNETI
jgi:hypothetical protein